jgi:hypothetical protein
VTGAVAALTSTVQADEAAGSITPAAGASLVGLADQAVSESGTGRTDLASFDLQQAASAVQTGRAQQTIGASAAASVQSDLQILAERLGIAGAATVPTVAPPTTTAAVPAPPAPGPAGRGKHHGGGNKGGDGG